MSPIARQILCTAVVLVLAASLSACDRGKPAPAAGPGQMPPPTVGVVVAERVAVPTIVELPGRTSPYLIAEVRPQVTGIIKQRAFAEGSEIQAGTLLYEIEPASYKAVHDSARAGLARAEANLEAARLSAQRVAGLAKSDMVSRQRHDEAQAALRQAEADVAAARAALERARIDLEFTRLTSPIDGRIGRSAVTAGALVTANQAQALAIVQQLDPIYVDLTQSSADLLRLRREVEAGRIRRDAEDRIPVQLVLEDGSEYAQPGRLAFSEVSVDPGTGSVTLRAVFPNPAGELLPGMYVRARLDQGVKEAILLPHAAVGRDPRGNATVMVVDGEGKVGVKVVQAERSLRDRWIVTDGLAGGERVIVEGLQRVRPGIPVTVEVAATAAAR
ncbi:MAG: efflux RND transporter periplasmic adaptor subunit [Rhodocyclaceae bacterium]|jgi:membrane fusion protein (multidrug efflux system)|nr:efflux RND transporter periplasmic adaptor subunit [Rhodocyclaceae bacterium]MCL4757541.1 efflux RND transporter periplasmic adaptor subunit [Rhodocyclaceae bacterium]